MRLKALASLPLALVVAASCTADPGDPTIASARFAKNAVSVCHVNGRGSYKLISIADPALSSHIAHGDAVPGAAVPGEPGKKFDAGCGVISAGPDFHTFFIRNNNGTIVAPWDADITLEENAAGDGYKFGTPRSGQKVGYGTNFFDGVKINTLESVNWNALSGMQGGIITYLNIWVTDGTNYAIIASENVYPGTNFTTRTEWKVFESAGNPCNGACPALDWLFDDGSAAGRSNQYLLDDGVNTTLGALGDNIVIGSPPSFVSPFIGTGAPRGGYGFNLIWGDTQANFLQPVGQMNALTITVAGTTHAASN